MHVDSSPTYRWIVYHFGGGDAYFFGIALIVVALSFAGKGWKYWHPSYSVCMALIGAFWMFLASVPMSIWVTAGGSLSLMTWTACELGGERTKKRRRICRSILFIAAILAFLLEVPFHLQQEIPKPREQILDVIGDSVSAGMGEKEAVLWPDVLAGHLNDSDWIVANHAQPGATVKSAIAQAKGIRNGIVSLEIGGNDVLGSTTPEDFEKQLRELFQTVVGQSRVVVMFELPLPPFKSKFGEIQRRLAGEHKVILIPRRVFVRVLATEGATLDGVHLSQIGHDLMAAFVYRSLKPIAR